MVCFAVDLSNARIEIHVIVADYSYCKRQPLERPWGCIEPVCTCGCSPRRRLLQIRSRGGTGVGKIHKKGVGKIQKEGAGEIQKEGAGARQQEGVGKIHKKGVGKIQKEGAGEIQKEGVGKVHTKKGVGKIQKEGVGRNPERGGGSNSKGRGGFRAG